jgi:protein ImuA
MTIHGLGPTLSRTPRRPQAGLPFLQDQTLARGRVHEFCGPARRMLALMAMAGCAGPVLWLRPDWLPERLCPAGIVPFVDPGRLIIVAAQRDDDLLWSCEEALRAGAAALVVAELSAPPGLTPVRRLHLAAEAGSSMGTGVILTPGDGGARGVESRWHASPDHRPGENRWQITLLRSRNSPSGCWTLTARNGQQDSRPSFTLSPARGPAVKID